MSDYYSPTDVELLNNDDYRAAQLRGALTGLRLAPGALKQVLPAGRDEQGNLEPTVPGMGTAAYGFLGGTVPDLLNMAVRGTTGYNLNIPHAPGADEAQRQYESTGRLANEILPVQKLAPPQSSGEAVMGDALESAGGMLVSIPGAVAKALPTAANVAAHLFAPSTKAAPMAAIGQGVATAGLEGYADDQNQKTTADALNTALGTTDTSKAASTATPLGQQITPDMSVGDALNQAVSNKPQVMPAPTFSEQGYSPWTVGNVVEGALLFAGALMAGKHFGILGRDVTLAARDARINDPAFAQKVADFNNAQATPAGQANMSAGLGPKVEAPLPSPSVAAAVKNQTLDSNALAKDYIALTSENPTAAARLTNQMGLATNDMSWQSTLREFLSTGVDYQTKTSMTPVKRLLDDIDALPNDKKVILNDGLYAANELDNRNKMMRSGTAGGYDFYNTSDQMLSNHNAAMMADPVLADIAQRYHDVHDKLIDIGVARNFLTPAEGKSIKAAHPNYVADTDRDGRILRAFGPRDLTPGGGVEQATTTAWNAMAQHVESLYRQFQLNEADSALATHFLDWQTKPGTAPILEKVKGPAPAAGTYPQVAPQGGPRENIITIRRGNGPEFYRVNNHDAYSLFTNSSGIAQRTMFDMASIPRRLLQQGTTGVLSAATGRMFPIVNVARTGFQAPINRPAGFRGGLLDWATRGVYRGFDPTNYIGAAYSGARSAVDDLAFHLSDMFDKSAPNFVTQTLKSQIGPQRMDLIRDTLRNYYYNTVTHEMRAQGIGGQGTPIRTNVPAFQTSSGLSSQKVRLVSGQLSPRIFMPAGKLGTVRAGILNLQNAAESVFQSVSDAGHEYFYRLNRARGGIDPATLAYETRALTGDPGVHGSGMGALGKTATAIRGAVPYSNVSAQGVGRQIRAVNESPVGATYAMVSSLGTAALLSLYTAMRNSDTRDYLQNTMTSQGQAANVTLFPHDDPTLNAQFSLPQELRAPYAIILDMTSKLLNLEAMQGDDLHHDSVYSFLKDWFSQHITNQSGQNALHGFADAANIIDIPAVFNAVSAMSGTSTRIDLDRIINDIRSGPGLFGNLGFATFNMPAGTDAPLPNHPPGDSLLEGADAKKFGVMLSNAFGMVSSIWDRLTGMDRYYSKSGDFWGSLGQVGQDWLQAAKDANPSLNTILWENPVRQSVRPPIVESVQRQLDAMKQTAGFNTAERYEGTTGGTRPLQVTPQSGPGRIPTDPTMRLFYGAVNGEYNFIQSSVMADITALKKQMADVSQQPMDNQQRRVWMNQQTRTIADKYRYVQARIDDLNAKLSSMIGKHVNVARIDWSKGPDQFN